MRLALEGVLDALPEAFRGRIQQYEGLLQLHLVVEQRVVLLLELVEFMGGQVEQAGPGAWAVRLAREDDSRRVDLRLEPPRLHVDSAGAAGFSLTWTAGTGTSRSATFDEASSVDDVAWFIDLAGDLELLP